MRHTSIVNILGGKFPCPKICTYNYMVPHIIHQIILQSKIKKGPNYNIVVSISTIYEWRDVRRRYNMCPVHEN